MKIRLFHIMAFSIIQIVMISLMSIPSWAEPVVIVHPGVVEASLSANNLKAAFTNKLPKWSDGIRIKPFILSDGKTDTEFFKMFIHKSPGQFKKYWKKQVFSGKGKMPKSTKSSAEIIKWVSTTPGAIGFVDAQDNSGEVKILAVE